MMREEEKETLKAEVEKWRKDWLKQWDGNCSICGKPVEQADLFRNGMPDTINGAVTGAYIEIYGHKTCVQNVNKLVVVPNRKRVIRT